MSPRVLRWRVLLYCATAAVCAAADWKSNFDAGAAALAGGDVITAKQLLALAYEQSRAFEPDDPRRVMGSFGLGAALQQGGDSRRAEPLLADAVAYYEKHRDGADEAVARVALAQAYIDLTQLDQAENQVRIATAIYDRTFGPQYSMTLLAKRVMADIRLAQERYSEAEALLQEALAGMRAAHEIPPTAIVLVLGDLGQVYIRQARYSDARPFLREAYELARKLGEDTLVFADCEANLGSLYRLEGNIARAEPLLRRAALIYDRADDPRAAGAHAGLALCLVTDGKAGLAVTEAKLALGVARQRYGPEHWYTAEVETTLAIASARDYQFDAAAVLLHHAADILARTFGASDARTVEVRQDLRDLDHVQAVALKHKKR